MDMAATHTAFGLGAYSPAEAARLLKISPGRLRRWVFGYSYKPIGRPAGEQPPLWDAQYNYDEDEPVIGFRDLIEARTVRRLLQIGLGLPTIRQCLRTAAQIAGDTHPFSTRKLKTDGKRLYLDLLNETDGVRTVIDLKQRQHAFAKVIEQTFLDLEFEGDVVARWWLNPKEKTLVIDPERSFGQPITADGGIPTVRLFEAVLAEKSDDRVASLFGIPRRVVRDAFRYEEGLRAAA